MNGTEEIIEKLGKNINTEINMLRDISKYGYLLESEATPVEKKLLTEVIGSLKSSMKLMNRAIPELVNNVSLAKKLPAAAAMTNLEQVFYSLPGQQIDVALYSGDKERFMEKLDISEELVKKLKRRKPVEVISEAAEYKGARGYLKASNKFFLGVATDMVRKGRFRTLAVDLKRANIDVLFQTYVAMMFFTAMLAFFAGLIIMAFLLLFNFSLTGALVSIFDGDYFARLLKIFWIPLAAPVATFLFLYTYPSTERGTIEKKINRELPFAVIHMSAISGSGIEPSKIFQIIGMSEEYPNLRKEIRKVMNQINVYGYDLVTSLNNASKGTPSEKLAELFSGLSSTISSGGDLNDYFEKRAQTLLNSYRLEREEFAKVTETFMDVYISVVVATPMMLLLLLVMLSVSNIDLGFSPGVLGLMIIFGVALINVIFLGVMHIKQPAY